MKTQDKVKEFLNKYNINITFPVNFKDILDKIDYKLSYFSPKTSEEKISNILGAVDYSKKTIFINNTLSYEERNMTIAHEIGHIYLHKNNENEIDYRNQQKTEKETQADEFAIELMMPNKELESLVSKMSIIELSTYFGLPISIIGHKIYDLNLIYGK